MKKYVKPEMNVELFDIEDAIATSEGGEFLGRLLKTTLNGHEGTDYGSEEVSVFEN